MEIRGHESTYMYSYELMELNYLFVMSKLTRTTKEIFLYLSVCLFQLIPETSDFDEIQCEDALNPGDDNGYILSTYHACEAMDGSKNGINWYQLLFNVQTWYLSGCLNFHKVVGENTVYAEIDLFH